MNKTNLLRVRSKHMRAILMAVLIGLSCPVNGLAKTKFETFESSIKSPDGTKNQTIDNELKTHKVNSVSLAIIENGKVVAKKAYGYMTKKKKVKVKTTTRYQVASLSKLAIGIAAADAAYHGKIKLRQNITKVAKKYPKSTLAKWIKKKFKRKKKNYPKDITVERLLNHSAGLNVHGIGTQWEVMTKSMDGIILGNIYRPRGVRPKHAPGTKYRYSGGAVTIAEHILELKTKLSFSKWATKNVLKPLRMNNSTYAMATTKMKNLAWGCSSAVCAYKVLSARVKGAGGLIATAPDYARMVIALMDFGKVDGRQIMPAQVIKGVLTASTTKSSSRKSCSSDSNCSDETCYLKQCRKFITETGKDNGYKDGLGVMLSGSLQADGYHRYVSHTGNQTGFSTKFYGDRQTKSGIVVFVAGKRKWTRRKNGKKLTYGGRALYKKIIKAYEQVYVD